MDRGVEAFDVGGFEVGRSVGGLGDEAVGCVKLIPDIRDIFSRFAYGSSPSFLSVEDGTLSVDGSSS